MIVVIFYISRTSVIYVEFRELPSSKGEESERLQRKEVAGDLPIYWEVGRGCFRSPLINLMRSIQRKRENRFAKRLPWAPAGAHKSSLKRDFRGRENRQLVGAFFDALPVRGMDRKLGKRISEPFSGIYAAIA